MSFSLGRIVQAVNALRAFESRAVARLAEAELVAAHDAAGRLLRLVEVVVSILAAEIARRNDAAREKGGGLARRHGHGSAKGMVAKSTGGTAGAAHDLINAGGLLGGDGDGEVDDGDDGAGREKGGAPRRPRYRHIATAYECGDISAAAAALLSQTLDQIEGGDEDIELRLVGKATRLSLMDLRKVCAQVTALWDQAQTEERDVRQRSARYLSLTEGADGMTRVSGVLDPASAAVIKTFLDAQVKAAFQQRRKQGWGNAEPGEAGRIRVDALVALSRHAMRCDQPGSGTSTEVVIRLDLEALRTGIGMGGCDALATPLTAGTMRRMAVDARILPVVLGSGSQPLDVGYSLRSFTPAQRTALAERDGGCAYCHAPVAWCDAHHIDWWHEHLGPTNLANGVLLCVSCHHRIHDDGWTVRATATEVWFTPPAAVDPRQVPIQGGKAALHVDAAGPPR
ncbi:HNH endonuclease signature motif containing protein [Demequina iriomotensis]|uniref:HNH endonuclease signature motif containing protein n=1 Tax=Demequina iriomotensis TaxID=1536641 RepID=UPI000B1C469B|nr:HNH endonuclease signature motif containing protein [Demequina iriomotensis]